MGYTPCFSKISGEKVNVHKSSFYYSANVSKECIENLRNISGLSYSTNLGNYLGVPLFHGRKRITSFKFLEDKVRSKLSGWKAFSLSFAGILTLVKSVLSTIPYYVMQIVSIPLDSCKRMERYCQNFLWGGDADHKRIHLIRCNQICRPKEERSLGVKRLHVMNNAFLMKLLWQLVTRPKSLWVSIIRGKYNFNMDRRSSSIYCHGASHTWNALSKLWNVFNNNLRWVLGDGLSIRFWKDIWLEDTPLLEQGHTLNIVTSENCCVREFLLDTGEWNHEKLATCLHSDLVNKILMFLPPLLSFKPDTPYWASSASGVCTVASTYEVLREDYPNYIGQQSRKWAIAWKWDGPQRIRTFLMQCLHGKLLTNLECRRRNMSSSATCALCSVSDESVLHLLRDCPHSKEVWLKLGSRMGYGNFFDLLLSDWLLTNLKNYNVCVDGIPWVILFGFTCWYIWKWRNVKVFEGKLIPMDRKLSMIKGLVAASYHAVQIPCTHSRLNGYKREMLVGWQNPPQGWVAVNTDGALRRNTNMAAAGGVFRDCNEYWLGGFAAKLGKCYSYRAELWGVLHSLRIVKEKGFSKIWLQVDNKIVVKAIISSALHPCANSDLLNAIHGLLQLD
ncbi:RNA-directed DNA polymerase (Reverse transcriptase), Polynucleotidyl transferase, Ribonuclease H fold-like protein [Theobroma cacao]|uniref:RNA-directed DNA polymerase (Reverse transcriptase), Polynucleotidyl transferase, Ribonuclease H fold-like protein n=1 Tax=Theobroma cacao TaxID=3641 RepID=A0A061GBA8_THECC|nr:RNA-directed DNA polymerase (Reverse transcriptase), Polynucleotidyl transferase, Ribonuclease H fold-like protein [Theobroma cacao]